MITKNLVLPNRYYDSVVLMSAAEKIKAEIDARQVSLMMGTDSNKDIMRATNLLTDEGNKAEPGDLIIAVVAEDEGKIGLIPDLMETMLAPKAPAEGDSYFPRSLDGAREFLPGANLAMLSIPGEYVEWEAEKALDRGMHLMLFSDNVPLETEIMLKKKGEEKGLLVMGPDCGTSIIHGAALAFANVVRRGSIGMVAAAGTGIQEVATLVHKMGGGISHAIGTGGRDLSKEVGGITMRMGIKMLLNDPETKVLVLVSKPPHPDVEKSILELVQNAKKPVIVNFLGSNGEEARKKGLKFAPTLEEASIMAIEAIGMKAHLPEPGNMDKILEDEVNKTAPSQKYLRGLYSGGTLTSETRVILEGMGIQLYSNVTKDPVWKLKDVFKSHDHTLVDLGDDDFTKGAPHPMIDNTKRVYRMLEEAEDPETAVILVDVVLGYGSNDDPASDIAKAAVRAQKIAHDAGRHLIFVASVCGVDEDPQNATDQVKKLEEAGIIVLPSCAKAARFVGKLLKRLNMPVVTAAQRQEIPTVL